MKISKEAKVEKSKYVRLVEPLLSSINLKLSIMLSSETGLPFTFILSLKLNKCGEVKVPTVLFFETNSWLKNSAVVPLPLVPPITITLETILDFIN